MTIAEWVSAANKLLKANPKLTYQQVEQQLAADGYKRPSGITQKGSSKGKRFGRKSPRTRGQDVRRAAQEQFSTESAKQRQQELRKQRMEQQGIADFAGLPAPHREHLYSQDISGEITEGAPGDYVENVPADIAAAKTALEQRIRTRYGNRYAVGLGVSGLRVIPREFFDERVNPDDLPGIDINETQSLEDQLGVLKSIARQAPPERLGGYQVEKPPVTVTGGSIRYKPQRLEGFATDASVPPQLPVTPKQDLSTPMLTFDTTPKPVDPVTTAIAVGGGIVLGFAEAVKGAVFGFR